MKRVAAYALLAGLLLFIPAHGQKNEIRQKTGSLEKLVERASENIIRRNSDGFRVPTPGQVKAWQFIVESIYGGRPQEAAQMIRQLSFPYELSRFTDKTSGREYFVLEEDYPLQAGWGLYVFDVRSANPLVIEVPHPVFDSNTEFQGIDAFLQTGARAFLLAGAHRRANTQDTPCTRPRSSDPDANYPVSDVAHAVATPFHAVHETLVRVRPDSVAVQLHGMAERENCPNAFISNGSKSVTTNSKKLRDCLTKSGVESEIYDGSNTCPLTGLSNVQGRFSNGETADPCTKGVTLSPEPGSFIHIEQESPLRRDPKSWRPVIDALRCAFPADGTKEPESFVFASEGNPDVKVFYSAPPKIDEKTRLLFVMAGRGRNADEYLASWTEWGKKNNYLVFSPLFDQTGWPEPLGYNFGNIASGTEAEPVPNPKSRWAYTVIEKMFDHARVKFGIRDKRYDIFGHSAGGQFVHRMMIFMPDNRVRRAIAANPGFYTLPDLTVAFPYGLGKSPVPISQKDIVEWTERDLVLMRGTDDVQRTENLRQSPEADAQGKNRFERSGFMFDRIRKVNPKTRWQLIDVPGVAHNQKGMALAAQKQLER